MNAVSYEDRLDLLHAWDRAVAEDRALEDRTDRVCDCLPWSWTEAHREWSEIAEKVLGFFPEWPFQTNGFWGHCV